MAVSTCPKCGANEFEVVEKQPHNFKTSLYFVQCEECGAVVGVIDTHYYKVEDRFEQVRSKIQDGTERFFKSKKL